MIGEKKLFAKLEKVLARSKADETEVGFFGTESALTRYANSIIHQNVAETNAHIWVRVAFGKRVGVASTNSLIDQEIFRALDDACLIAKQQPENPEYPGMPKSAKYHEMNTFDEDTAKLSPAKRAAAVKKIIGKGAKAGFTMAGALSNDLSEIAIVNSRGVRAYQPATSATVNMIAMSDDSSGYAGRTARRVSELDFDALASAAVQKCADSRKPRQIEPGEFEVILEPAAVAELSEWLNYIAFGSKMYEQKLSFLAGRSGKKITSDQISFYDDAMDEAAMAFPFDFEGVPKKKVWYVKNGIAGEAVMDSTAAKKAGKKSTGHAIMPEYADEGAFGMNLFVGAGKAKREKMVSNVKRGILVTRFHYINGYIDPRNAVLTGMTRDGTFLIENGEIVGGLKNLRFTDNMLRAFGSVQAISKEREQHPSWWSSVGCMTVPALHLASFKFSGKTDF